MKYYADYMKDRFYAIDEKGRTIVKMWDFDTNSVVVLDGGVRNVYPWLSEENGVGFYVEEMTKEEFDTIGEKWVWLNAPVAMPGGMKKDDELMYRYYMKWL